MKLEEYNEREPFVEIEDRWIKTVSSSPIATPSGAQVIDGGGRVLMPGLTDAHWHMTDGAERP
jgi:imidazolonepropionase-like amidohydrolase